MASPLSQTFPQNSKHSEGICISSGFYSPVSVEAENLENIPFPHFLHFLHIFTSLGKYLYFLVASPACCQVTGHCCCLCCCYTCKVQPQCLLLLQTHELCQTQDLSALMGIFTQLFEGVSISFPGHMQPLELLWQANPKGKGDDDSGGPIPCSAAPLRVCREQEKVLTEQALSPDLTPFR